MFCVGPESRIRSIAFTDICLFCRRITRGFLSDERGFSLLSFLFVRVVSHHLNYKTSPRASQAVWWDPDSLSLFSPPFGAASGPRIWLS